MYKRQVLYGVVERYLPKPGIVVAIIVCSVLGIKLMNVESVSYTHLVSGDLSVTEFIMNNTFWVGVYPGMTDAMIDYMAEIIKEAVKL